MSDAPCLLRLPNDLFRHVASFLTDLEHGPFAASCTAALAVVRAHRHGVVLKLPPGPLNTKQLAAVFPKFKNRLLPPPMQAKLTQNGFRFDLKQCLPAILDCYGGWKGLAERERAAAERSAGLLEKRRAAQAYRTARMDKFIAESRWFPHASLADWRRSLQERGLAPPEAHPVIDEFLALDGKPPSIFQARSAVQEHERTEEAFLARRSALINALLALRIEGVGEHDRFVAFCERGRLEEAASVAKEIATDCYLALHADAFDAAVDARAAELATGFGTSAASMRAHALEEVRAGWPRPDVWPWLECEATHRALLERVRGAT